MDTSGWETVNTGTEVPQQKNGFDCGLFMLKLADCAALGIDVTDSFSQEHMPAFRRLAVAQILTGSLDLDGATVDE